MAQKPILPRPTGVTVEKDRAQLQVMWADGRESVYSFEQLRAACPCAECQAHRSQTDPLSRATLVSIGLGSVELVGNYAIQLIWDDGHRFGIYSWEYLRQLG